ncbi:MAG: mycothiol synthase [Nocardioidaceae bacterium]
MSTLPPAVERLSRLEPADRAAVLDLVAAAESADKSAPLNEATLLAMGHPGATQAHLVSRDGDRLVGYLQWRAGDDAPADAEVVVAPANRRHGRGGALVTGALELSGGDRLRMWSHGDQAGAVVLAGRLGFDRVRELWQLRRALSDLPRNQAVGEGITIRPFRPGEDEQAWLALNAEAFAHHPEQGRMTRADLDERMTASWFDPRGFFLAEREGTLVGFHWTKVHAGTHPVGEIYVLGVSPEAQGLGLGRTLTSAGLEHLASRGLASVMLYVESDNDAANRLYAGLGFHHVSTDVQYLSAH